MSNQLEFILNISDEKCFEEVLNTYDLYTKKNEIPLDIVQGFVVSLCRIVNIESYSQKAWSIVRDIAQSQQSSILISHLLSILNDSFFWHHPIILRGSVFFLGMSLWGYHRIESLDVPYNVVLTYFYYVLSCKHGLVVNEVLKTIRRLISKFGAVLKVEYQIISKILSKSRQILEIHADETILSTLMDILRSLQKQKKTNKFLSDYEIGLNTIVPLTSFIDEDIIIAYLEDIESSLTVLNTSWKSTLEIILKSFFVRDNRSNIRKKVLEIVKSFYESNVDVFGDDILQVSVPIMKHAFDDMDDNIIELYLNLYFTMCQNVSNQKFLVLIENVYQLLYSPNTSILTKRRIVIHFNRLFVNKLPTSNVSQVIEIFKKLLKFISFPDYFIRAESVKTLAKLSGTHKYTIKYKDIHCPYIKFFSKSSSNKNQKLLPVHELIEEFRNRIKKEESRDIFYLLIQGILGFFYNGWILVQADISSLTTLICRLLENKIFGFFLNQKELDINKDNYVTNGYEIIISSLCYLLPRESDINELLINTLATSITEGFCKNYSDDYAIQLCLKGLIQCSLYKVKLFAKLFPSILDSIEKICSKISTFTESNVYLIDFIYFLSLRNELAKIGIENAGKLIQILMSFFKNNDEVSDTLIQPYAFQALISWFNQFDNQTRLNYFEPVRKKIMKLKNRSNSLMLESYMDLLTKIVFIDCNPMLLNEETFLFKENDDIKISGWIKGNSLLVIKTNKMGWSQVTVRRPSGKYTWMMQIQNKLRNIKSSITSIVEIPPSYFESLYEGIFESANAMSNEIEDLRYHLTSIVSIDSPRISRLVEEVPQTTEEYPSIFLDLGDMVYSDDLFDVPLSPKNRRSIEKDDEGYISSVSTSSYSQLPSYEESYQEEYDGEEDTESDIDIRNEEPDNKINHEKSSDSIKIRIMEDVEDIKPLNSRSYDMNQIGRSKSDENILSQEMQGNKKHDMPFSEKFKKSSAKVRQSKRSSSFSKRLSTDSTLFETRDKIKSIHKLHEKIIINNDNIDHQPLKAKPHPLLKKRSEESLIKRIPNRRHSADHQTKLRSESDELDNKQTLIHPSFIFLQFQQLPNIKSYSDRLHISRQFEEAMLKIDEIPPYETFAINVIYVGYEQRSKEAILSNHFGSLEYENFIDGLGSFKRLKDCKYYTGGLDTSNDLDGKYFILFKDKLRHIAFHISTMIHNNRHDLKDSNIDVSHKINIMKNNYITIVWNEYSNEEYDPSIMEELHEYVTIIITPLEKKLYKIKIEKKIDIPYLSTMLETQVVGEEVLCDLIRLTSISAFFSVQRYLCIQGKNGIFSNFEKRLKLVQSFRDKFQVGHSLKSPQKKKNL